MFWKEKKKMEPQSSIILGMILMNDTREIDAARFKTYFEEHFGTELSDITSNGSTVVFTVDGETIALAMIPLPVPAGELNTATGYAYYWPEAANATAKHQAHIILTMMAGSEDAVKRHMIYTQVTASLMAVSDAIAMYIGGQSLIISKESYLDFAEEMDEENLPLNLWIYFGFRMNGNGNSMYTYGLKQFGKLEMEIVNSKKELSDIQAFLFNITHYLLETGAEFRDGQTCGGSEDEVIAISLSKGVHLEDEQTLKLAY